MGRRFESGRGCLSKKKQRQGSVMGNTPCCGLGISGSNPGLVLFSVGWPLLYILTPIKNPPCKNEPSRCGLFSGGGSFFCTFLLFFFIFFIFLIFNFLIFNF